MPRNYESLSYPKSDADYQLSVIQFYIKHYRPGIMQRNIRLKVEAGEVKWMGPYFNHPGREYFRLSVPRVLPYIPNRSYISKGPIIEYKIIDLKLIKFVHPHLLDRGNDSLFGEQFVVYFFANRKEDIPPHLLTMPPLAIRDDIHSKE